MGEFRQIILCGFGGQGIILAGTILGYAGINDGKWVAVSNSYGAAARGGACRAEVVIADKPIIFPHVIEADILIAMFGEAYNKYVKRVKCENGIVIYDEQFVFPEKISNLKFIGIPATRIAIEEVNNKLAANMVILGAATEITKVVTTKALISAVEEMSPKGFRELNLKAIDIGFKIGKMSSL